MKSIIFDRIQDPKRPFVDKKQNVNNICRVNTIVSMLILFFFFFNNFTRSFNRMSLFLENILKYLETNGNSATYSQMTQENWSSQNQYLGKLDGRYMYNAYCFCNFPTN